MKLTSIFGINKEKCDTKFELSLQQLSLLCKAKSTWQQRDTVRKIKNFWNQANTDLSQWHYVIYDVLKSADSGALPPVLERELQFIIKEVGKKIYYWSVHVFHILLCNKTDLINYTAYQCWTWYGTIDVIRTIQSFWVNNPKLDVCKVYNMACIYALETEIDALWEIVPRDRKISFCNAVTSKYDQDRYLQIMLTYWKYYYRDLDITNCLSIINIFTRYSDYNNRLLFNQNDSVEVNLFRFATYEGYSNAVSYFWDRMTLIEQEKNLLSSVFLATEHITGYIPDRRYCQLTDNCRKGGYCHAKCHNLDHANLYKIDQYMQIYFFLTSQMTEEDMNKYLTVMTSKFYREYPNDRIGIEYYNIVGFENIFKWFLVLWPWQELFMQQIDDEIVPLINDNTKLWNKILLSVEILMLDDYKMGYPVENCKYQKMLHELWQAIPNHNSLKLSVLQLDDSDSNLITKLLEMWDLSSLKLMLLSPEVMNCKMKILESNHRFLSLVESDHYDILDHFVDEILITDEEKKMFKHSIDIWLHFILGPRHCHKLNGCKCSVQKNYKFNLTLDFSLLDYLNFWRKRPLHRFDLANKLLDWQCDSYEERLYLKSRINETEVCQFYIQVGFHEFADDFLTWLFESEDEIIEFKGRFGYDEFCSYKFLSLWYRRDFDLEQAKNESARLLKFLVGSNDEVIDCLKKEELIRWYLETRICNSVPCTECSVITNNLLKWCPLSKEERKVFKNRLECRKGLFWKLVNYL